MADLSDVPRTTGEAGLPVQVWGEGVDAVLVHGSITTGAECWEGQRPLAEHGYRLLIPDRRGYGETAGHGGEDFRTDAADVAEMLGTGAHLVGHSYGAIAALLAAAERPEATLSLAVIEPPVFALAEHHPAIAELVTDLKTLWTRSDSHDREFLEGFLRTIGAPVEEIPEAVLEHWTGQVGPLRHCRPPWSAEVPIDRLRQAQPPKLIVSGGHHPAFDAVCDELAPGIGADHAVITGAGHDVPMMAEQFNAALLSLWRYADEQASTQNRPASPARRHHA